MMRGTNQVPRVRSGTRPLVAAAASGVLLAAGTVLLPSAALAAETCHGQAATVVPDADGDLIGTPGPDVVVAHGGQRVKAGDGDDLICLVDDEDGVQVDAGPGDDTVDATQSLYYSIVSLGLGEDSFVGGPGEDQVQGSAFQDLEDLFTSRWPTPSATTSRRAAGTTRSCRARWGQPTPTSSPPAMVTTA